MYPSQKRRKQIKPKIINVWSKLFLIYSSKMNRGQLSRQGPKRKPLLVNLSSDDEEVQFVQQIGPSGTRNTSRGTSRGRGQGRGSNKGQIRPNFGRNQNKSLPSTSHHSSSTDGEVP